MRNNFLRLVCIFSLLKSESREPNINEIKLQAEELNTNQEIIAREKSKE